MLGMLCKINYTYYCLVILFRLYLLTQPQITLVLWWPVSADNSWFVAQKQCVQLEEAAVLWTGEGLTILGLSCCSVPGVAKAQLINVSIRDILDFVQAKLSSYPGYFQEPHWLSMGLLELSRVTLTGMYKYLLNPLIYHSFIFGRCQCSIPVRYEHAI